MGTLRRQTLWCDACAVFRMDYTLSGYEDPTIASRAALARKFVQTAECFTANVSCKGFLHTKALDARETSGLTAPYRPRLHMGALLQM